MKDERDATRSFFRKWSGKRKNVKHRKEKQTVAALSEKAHTTTKGRKYPKTGSHRTFPNFEGGKGGEIKKKTKKTLLRPRNALENENGKKKATGDVI